jgi:hypothetical protein
MKSEPAMSTWPQGGSAEHNIVRKRMPDVTSKSPDEFGTKSRLITKDFAFSRLDVIASWCLSHASDNNLFKAELDG